MIGKAKLTQSEKLVINHDFCVYSKIREVFLSTVDSNLLVRSVAKNKIRYAEKQFYLTVYTFKHLLFQYSQTGILLAGRRTDSAEVRNAADWRLFFLSEELGDCELVYNTKVNRSQASNFCLC